MTTFEILSGKIIFSYEILIHHKIFVGKNRFSLVNVTVVCDFDMIFRYVVGWKGMTHDPRVLIETIHNLQHNFPMLPSGKCFICILFNKICIYS